jgi:putative transposase
MCRTISRVDSGRIRRIFRRRAAWAQRTVRSPIVLIHRKPLESSMARKPRVHVPGGFYHATLRGNHRQEIFREPADRARLQSIVAHAAREVRARIHAYCWMTNHIHLLVEVGDAPLGALMHRIASPYARDMQKRSTTTGHFFERRYHARIVDSEWYLLSVIRYMHFNPVRSGLARRPDDYAWSSHHCYLGTAEYPWVTTDYALGMLAPDIADARRGYRAYMAEGEGAVLTSPFDAAVPANPPNAGGSSLGEAVAHQQAPGGRAAMTLDELIHMTCADHGISVMAVTSRQCSRPLGAARVEIARRALESGTANLSEVSRALGRSVAALGQALRRRRQPG